MLTDYDPFASLSFKCNNLERHLKKHHNLLEQLQNLVEDENSGELEQVSSPVLHDTYSIFY